MLAGILLVVSVMAEDMVRPRFTHLSSGEVEISVDDMPGRKLYNVQYTISGVDHNGPFHQAADGRWYHRNHGADYKGKDKIQYELLAENNGKMVVTSGIINPDESGLLLSPPKIVRRGTVVFRDDFNGAFDARNWNYEVSMYGGYNGEMQAYVPDTRNIYTKNGHLFIKPTLTVDYPGFDEHRLQNGTMDMTEMYGYCTNSDIFGCVRQAPPTLPPVMSGKLTSKESITFGKVEVRARVGCGDWLWPGIWMMPRDNAYGKWPRSGEMDLIETRGNLDVIGQYGHNYGRHENGATLHWGPDAPQNRYMMTHGTLDGEWCHSFHTYRLEWTADYILVFFDDHIVLNVPIDENFWKKGKFEGDDVWVNGTKAAPFDKPFYLILNVAVGSSNGFFPDVWHYNTTKPWINYAPTKNADFWSAKDDWFPTWNGDDAALEIDYVEVTQY